MKSKIKNSLYFIFASILAVFFIVITAKQINLEKFRNILKETNYFWIFVSTALSILSYWIRAARWKLLLKPMGYNTKTSSAFWAISFAYFMNLTIPRSGEVARATSFYKMENVPFEKSFGTVVLERVIDLFFLLIFIGLSLIFNYRTFLYFIELGNKEKINKNTYETSYTKYYIVLALFIITCVILIFFWKKFIKSKLYNQAKKFFLGIKEGIQSISKLQKKKLFIFYSLSLWICYFLMMYLALFAFKDTENLNVSEALFLLVAGSFGMILPVSGGLAYPYVMSIAFSAIYLSKGINQIEGKNVGDYFGLILYIANVITMIIFGIIAIWKISKTKKDIKQV